MPHRYHPIGVAVGSVVYEAATRHTDVQSVRVIDPDEDVVVRHLEAGSCVEEVQGVVPDRGLNGGGTFFFFLGVLFPFVLYVISLLLLTLSR